MDLQGPAERQYARMNLIWCNGHWRDSSNYPGSCQDRGAFLGLGLFETLLAIDGAPVFGDRHLARLRNSCLRLGWTFELPDFAEIAAELLARNNLSHGRARLRLVVTAGSGQHHDLTPGADRLVWLSAYPMAEFTAPMAVCISPWPRNEFSPLAGMKTSCYAENLVALDHARQRGFDETLFLNTANQLCEFATANLFLVKSGVLHTPSLESGCLPGVAREVVIKLAGLCRLGVEERLMTLEDLHEAEEVFLTSSLRGPVEVVRVDERHYSKGSVTARLRDYWKVEIARR